jgi:hypothetical protein
LSSRIPLFSTIFGTTRTDAANHANHQLLEGYPLQDSHTSPLLKPRADVRNIADTNWPLGTSVCLLHSKVRDSEAAADPSWELARQQGVRNALRSPDGEVNSSFCRQLASSGSPAHLDIEGRHFAREGVPGGQNRRSPQATRKWRTTISLN